MALFKSQGKKLQEEVQKSFETLNWSNHFSENSKNLFSVSKPLEFGLPATISAMAYDPLQSLLAVATVHSTLHVWGAPGVSLSWRSRPAHSIKFLTFKPGCPYLISIDIKDTLVVYDLSKLQDGVPLREYTHSVRSVVTCLAVSPAHSHMFLGLKDGTIDCFDLDCGVMSPYRIRNLWLEQEDLLRRSGVPGAPSRRHIPMCTDIKLHPYDLNLLLISHEGGTSLYNLKQETVIRSFELIIPPGAIGSNFDSADPSVFEERRPSVNCVCFRPDGEVFVSGHSDGCLAFWSIEDGDLPLLVKTMDREDALSFDWNEPDPKHSGTSDAPTPLHDSYAREPIFRLAWSHFTSEPGTKLTVLGGLLPRDPIGIHVFHLPDHQMRNNTSGELDDDTRNALRASISSTGHSVYLTTETPEDFLLVPISSPYFDNAHNPIGIIISSTYAKQDESYGCADSREDGDIGFSSRTVHAYTFPPNTNEEPKEYLLPGSFDWIGAKSVFISEIFEVSTNAHQALLCSREPNLISTHKNDTSPGRLPLHGGQIGVSNLISSSLQEDYQEASSLIAELSKKRRILVTVHMDYKIRFWDFTLALLLPKRPKSSSGQDIEGKEDCLDDTPYDMNIITEFPNRLDHLTIDLSALFNPPSSAHLKLNLARPTSVKLNKETLDLLIVLANGDSLVYNFRRATISRGGSTEELGIDTSVSAPLRVVTSEPNSSQLDELSEAMNEAMVELSVVPPPSTTTPTDPVFPKATNTSGAASAAPPRPARSPQRMSRNPSNIASPNPQDGDATPDHERSLGEDDLFHTFVDLASVQDPNASRSGFHATALVRLSKRETVDSTAHRFAIQSTQDQCSVLVAFEDMGFLAIAQPNQDQLKIIDMRKATMLFNGVSRKEGKSKDKGKSRHIRCLTWVVSRTDTEHSVFPRLLVGYDDGLFNIITLQPFTASSIDTWKAVSVPANTFGADHHSKSSRPNAPIAVFVFGSDGHPILANRNNLAKASMPSSPNTDDHRPRLAADVMHAVSILVFSHSVVVRMNINGPQLAKQTDISTEPTIKATIISHRRSYALVLIDQSRACYVLGLPNLELLCRTFMQVPDGTKSMGKLSVDSSADIIEHIDPVTTHLTTLMFGRDSVYVPCISVYDASVRTPEPPQARTGVLASAANLTTNLVSWFQGSTAGPGPRTTGPELDRILAGPSRPENKKATLQPPRGAQVHRPVGFVPTRSGRRSPLATEESSKDRSIAKAAANGQSARAQLNHNIDGLDERADRLRFLNERFDDMSQAASELAQQAKKVSQQQAAKTTFSVGMSSMKSLFK